jgi:hypothetical protein
MSKTVLMITPGYPGEMPYFTRGLSVQGATVLGVANGPAHELSGVGTATSRRVSAGP